jgi:hypothetical protein
MARPACDARTGAENLARLAVLKGVATTRTTSSTSTTTFVRAQPQRLKEPGDQAMCRLEPPGVTLDWLIPPAAWSANAGTVTVTAGLRTDIFVSR